MKLKKGSAEAKRFMASIRAKKKGAKKVSGVYDTIKRNVTATKKKVAYSVIDKAIKSANAKEKKDLASSKRIIKNTYIGQNKTASTHKDSKSHNVRISVISGLNRNFRRFKIYKKHLIDIVELTKGGKQYIVNSTLDGKDIPIFFAKSMAQAKVFIDRAVYLLNKYK